ncbi:hypothetical protein OBBRIDRAFT_66720 [Obba rivulosa]|uniref:Uncharacterized protein n=1 Tax=Obba rivulosa TaxID=1052685 RepID=A0A8E2DIX5_9APHY|nr:hypothetical protein OBBRIDRAFT_66720 [Obba rivulosa]
MFRWARSSGRSRVGRRRFCKGTRRRRFCCVSRRMRVPRGVMPGTPRRKLHLRVVEEGVVGEDEDGVEDEVGGVPLLEADACCTFGMSRRGLAQRGTQDSKVMVIRGRDWLHACGESWRGEFSVTSARSWTLVSASTSQHRVSATVGRCVSNGISLPLGLKDCISCSLSIPF